MRQNFTLNINNPCPKKFETFEPTKDGGFCFSCQREVIDFTKMSEDEIIQYFQNKQPHICGRFQSSQLKTYPQKTASKRKYNFRLGIGLMSLSLFSILPLSHSQAQNSKQSIALNIPQKSNLVIKSKTDVEEYVLEGKVIDERGEPIIAVSVTIKGTTLGTLTDYEGKFKLSIPSLPSTIIFSSIGYQTKVLDVTNETPQNMNITMTLYEDLLIIGAVNVNQVYQSKPSFWQKIKGIFKK